MTCFRVGHFGTSATPQFGTFSGQQQQQQQHQPTSLSNRTSAPLVEFSTRENRASLMSLGGLGSTSSSLSGRSRRRRRRTQRRSRLSATGGVSRRRRRVRTTRVRIVKGKVALRVSGFPNVQRLGASQLVRFVPLNKLRAAAKKVLGRSGRHRIGSRGRRLRRKGQRTHRRRRRRAAGSRRRRRV